MKFTNWTHLGNQNPDQLRDHWQKFTYLPITPSQRLPLSGFWQHKLVFESCMNETTRWCTLFCLPSFLKYCLQDLFISALCHPLEKEMATTPSQPTDWETSLSLFCVLVVHVFSLLDSVPLYKHDTVHYLFYYQRAFGKSPKRGFYEKSCCKDSCTRPLHPHALSWVHNEQWDPGSQVPTYSTEAG